MPETACQHTTLRFAFDVSIPVYLENGRLVVEFDPDPEDETHVECPDCGREFNRGEILAISALVNDAWSLAFRALRMTEPESLAARPEDLAALAQLVAESR